MSRTMAGEAGLAPDVLVIGGGGAGLRAAIAVAEADARLSVAVVSKVYPMRSHTVSAEGGAAGVIRAIGARQLPSAIHATSASLPMRQARRSLTFLSARSPA